MFSSIGQIVGLIEIEPATSGDSLSDALQVECPGDADALDASLDGLLARLVGRSATGCLPGSRTDSTSALRPINRLAPPDARQTADILLGADLVQLEADLADETRRLRAQLAAVGLRTAAR
jgi:hypothetical protein